MPTSLKTDDPHGGAEPPRAPVEGADFSKLPMAVQKAVVKGLFDPHQEWQPLSEFLKAPPERRLAAIRELKGLTQNDVAKKAGVRQADVSAAERDIGQVRLDTIRKITDVLGLRVSEVLSDEATSDSK